MEINNRAYPEYKSILTELFNYTMETYHQFLVNWIITDDLYDPYEEFFINLIDSKVESKLSDQNKTNAKKEFN